MYEHPPRREKLELIEQGYKILPFNSFADLGGCWGVHGAYGFHAAELCGGEGFIVDMEITPKTRERIQKYPKMKTVETMLGSQQAKDAVGLVDCLIMYDILLHQVDPDWDQFILNWLPHTQMVIINNQNWTKTVNTIRFVDQGIEWFKNNVVYVDEAALDRWFAAHGEYDHDQGKLKRDIHNFWQWGIVQRDILNLFAKNGFTLHLLKEYGPFNPEKSWVVVDGMIFVRDGALPARP